MVPQITGRWKGSWTLWAGVRLVLGKTGKISLQVLNIKANLDMCHSVVIEVGASSKAFATGLALVWLFTSVNTSVSVQRGAR